ncbi:MAG: hypothetical protein ABSE48_02480 [Verrucomicrobiota bacterium]|jgi:hypothetical protein
MITRRRFFFDCSTALSMWAFFPVNTGQAAGTPALRFQSLDLIGYQALAAQVNTLFRVGVSPERMVELQLLKARLAEPALVRFRRSADTGIEKFSLIFSGPADDILAAAIHRFEHDKLGRFDMYIGQVGTNGADSVRYESVFNRPARPRPPSEELPVPT